MVCRLRTLLPLVLVVKLSRHRSSIDSYATSTVFNIIKCSNVALQGCACCSVGETVQTAEIIATASMAALSNTQLLIMHLKHRSRDRSLLSYAERGGLAPSVNLPFKLGVSPIDAR
jgi:hypothetical protein